MSVNPKHEVVHGVWAYPDVGGCTQAEQNFESYKGCSEKDGCKTTGGQALTPAVSSRIQIEGSTSPGRPGQPMHSS